MTATQEQQIQQQVERLLSKHAQQRETHSEAFAAVETFEGDLKSAQGKKLVKARDQAFEALSETATMLRLAGYTLEHDDSEPVAPQAEPAKPAAKLPDNAITTDTGAFVPTSGLTSKKGQRVEKLVGILRGTHEPIEFAEAAKQAGEKYAQDIQAAAMALETLGMVESWHEHRDGSERSKLFVRWVQQEQAEAEAPDAA